MADVTIKVLTPALTFALLTLDELKIMLDIELSDTSSDVRLQQMIDQYSGVVSEITNRVFARERVRETWRCLQGRRIYLSHWPVKESDIESITVNGTALTTTDWELEERSGKLSLFGSRAEPIVVTYIGGFDLPDEAPDALKNAAVLLLSQGKSELQRDATAGIRSISHKDSRIMFFDPNASKGGSTGSTTGNEAIRAAHSLLYHYTRLEV